MPKLSLGQGATTWPGAGVGKAGEKQIALINTPWLPPTPSWEKSTIYEPTVLTQGEASQQYSSVCIASGFSFLPPGSNTGGRVAPQGWWEDHDTGSKEALVLTPPLSLSNPDVQLSVHPGSSSRISLGIRHWGLFVCLFPVDRTTTTKKYFCQTSAGPTLLESNHL